MVALVDLTDERDNGNGDVNDTTTTEAATSNHAQAEYRIYTRVFPLCNTRMGKRGSI